MNKLDLIVFDMETGGLDWQEDEAIQIAGKAYNMKTLQPYPVESGGEFESLMKPLRPEKLKDEALKINGKTREMLANAPDQKVVWNQFVKWVEKYNPTKNKWGAPIAGGKNIRTFDFKFMHVLNQLHCPKKEKTIIFNERQQIDLEDIILLWFDNEQELPNMKMDTLRPYFGLSSEKAHDALGDVRDTGELIMRFFRLSRDLRSRKMPDGSKLIKFKKV